MEKRLSNCTQHAVWQYGGRRIYSQLLFANRLQFQQTNTPSYGINNELLFINLAAVTGWRFSNTATSPSRSRCAAWNVESNNSLKFINQMNIQSINCYKCGVRNLIATCSSCRRSFVLTTGNSGDNIREFNDRPLTSLDKSVSASLCDLCKSAEVGNPKETIMAGLSQRTCANCKTEFLLLLDYNPSRRTVFIIEPSYGGCQKG